MCMTMPVVPTSRPFMGQATFTTSLTVAELEAITSLYGKALRILIREGNSREKIRRNVCWHRLMDLHHSLPRQFENPEHLYSLFKRNIGA